MPEDEVPAEIMVLAQASDDAYISWVEARRQMNDMAKSRGFYPVTQTVQYHYTGPVD